MPTTTACDACKLRKVKCDMTDPCANCRISELRCAYNILPRRRGRKVGARLSVRHGKSGPRTATGTETRSTAARHDVQSTGSPKSPELWQQRRSLIPPTLGLSAHVPHTNVLNLGDDLATGSSPIPAQIHEGLLRSINSALPSDTVPGVIHRCVDLFAQYLFPVTPALHEPTIRAGVSLFGPESHPELWQHSLSLSPLKTFTLITALCASVASVMPDSLLAQRHPLSVAFLKASRSMHHLYQDHDLEHPDSSSLMILGASWHCLWEATLIAQRLRLYDEESVSQRDAIESQLLRASFWQLYAADKASCAFENRPYVLNEFLFNGDLTLQEHGDNEEPLLDTNKSCNQGSLETRLLAGFHLKRHIWSAAGNLVLEINSYGRQKKRKPTDSEADESALTRLTDSYLAFTAIIDDLPPWLHGFHDDDNDDADAEAFVYHKTCFSVQRSNLMTTFHCLRLIILQKCVSNDTLAVIGLENQGLSLPIKKLEIVHDFLQELQIVPFICFKVLGEAAVERIRRVGAILLELIETVEHDTLSLRSKALFQRILDFLAKLDSKTSDTLNGA